MKSPARGKRPILKWARIAILAIACALAAPALGEPKDAPYLALSPVDAVKRLGLSKAVRSDPERVQAIVAEAIEAGRRAPLFRGPRGAEATAYLLLGIAFHEGGLKVDVEFCSDRGDHGFAYGLPQIHPEHFPPGVSAEDVCLSRPLQWAIAASILRRAKVWCKMQDPDHEDRGPEVWLGVYHQNACGIDGVARAHFAHFLALCRNTGILVFRSGREWWAVSVPGSSRR